MTDQDILKEIQYHLLELVDSGASWASGLWTVDEVSTYLNQRQRRFLIETGIIISQADVLTIPNVERHALPGDWMATRRVAWHSASGTLVPIPRGDTIQSDVQYGSTFLAGTRPQLYIDTEAPPLQIQIAPPCLDAGLLEIWYIARPEVLSNNGTSLVLPDEFAPAIKWGTMADMLSKSGNGYDPERAAYCEQRYQEWVEMAKIMSDGYGA